MKYFNVAVVVALLALFGFTVNPVENGSWRESFVSEINYQFADITDVSPFIYTGESEHVIPLDQAEATQFYLRHWFGTICWIMAGLNIAFYAGQISKRGNGQWEQFKQTAYNRICIPREIRSRKKAATDTTEVFESV